MDAMKLQEFRAMQLAVIGACAVKYDRKVITLPLEGLSEIFLGDNIVISEVSLVTDCVAVSICGHESYMPITKLSDNAIDEVIATMQAKAVEIAGIDVMVNLATGKLDMSDIRL